MKPTVISKNRLQIGYINIRSAKNKLEFIIETVIEHSLDLFFITETWLHSSETEVFQSSLPKNYKFRHVPRSDDPHIRGGGVGIIFKDIFTKIKPLTDFQNKLTFEAMALSFYSSNLVVNTAVVYRPGHQGTDQQFMNEFNEFLCTFGELGSNYFICGDFNYWLDEPQGKPYTSNFIETIEANNCINSIDRPTHIAGHTLDLLIHDCKNTSVNEIIVYPIDGKYSDHALITFNYIFPTKKSAVNKCIAFRNYKNLNIENIRNEVNEIYSTLNNDLPINNLVYNYNTSMQTLHEKHFPLIEKTIKIQEENPWYDTSISLLRKERRKAERKWRTTRTEASRKMYIESRSDVVKAVDHKKKEYFRSTVKECKSNQAKLWRVIRQLTGNPEKMCPSDANPNDVNTFFIDKIASIRNDLDNSTQTNYSDMFTNHLAIAKTVIKLNEFKSLGESDVAKIVKSVNNTYCCLDPFNYKKVPSVIPSLTPLITSIINKCFSTGIFPTSEKMAIVKPLLKKPSLNINEWKNLRPVSHITFLSKCIEKAILDQLLPQLSESKQISDFQSAYRHHHSTETALCRIYNDLIYNIQNGHPSLLILLDLSAAFDTIDHNLLVADLEESGVSNKALALLKSYIHERQQKVQIAESLSEPLELKYGVPQGSVLGPILFSLYSSKLSDIMSAHNINYHLYADDTQIYMPLTDIPSCSVKLSALLSDIKLWMQKRKLKLNTGKTEVILIKGNLKSDFNLSTKNINVIENITPSTAIRDLGLYFDTKLSFHHHFNHIVKSCNFQLRKLSSVIKFLDINTANMLMHAFITSRIDYCNSLFVNLPKKDLTRLQSIMNRAARIVFKLPPFTSTSSYLYKLHWLPIRARIEFKICLLVYKTLKYESPAYLHELLTRYSPQSNVTLRAADDPHLLVIPRLLHHSSFGIRAFSYAGPKLFNSLPSQVKNASNDDTFKKLLKTHLFNKSYDLKTKTISIDYRV